MVMSAVKQRYRDISPVTLQVVGGAVSSSLYCGEVEGVAGGLVEAFMVEFFRCKLCQFTCGLKDAISSHLQLRHRPPSLTYLGPEGQGGGAVDREEAGLQLKQSDEDEDFLLYDMLDNMSPPTCDISSEVAHTCEVTTLFESSMFPLKGGSVDLVCPPSTSEQMAQSAHLMTLGLCRISATGPAAASAGPPRLIPASPRPPRERSSSSCPLCPLTLPSRRLLDVHVRSHRAGGGFGCVCCSWTAGSWEELQPHWRRHQREERKKRKKKKKAVCLRSVASPDLHHGDASDGWSRLTGRAGEQGAELTDRCQTGAVPSISEKKKTSRRKKEEENKSEEAAAFCCSLCHRKFSTKLTLRRHLGTHGGEKPFSCQHCDYSSRLKASLRQHLRTHTGEKPYRCAECPYASIDRSSLLRHSRTHSQDRPYRCPHCDYSSIQKKSLDLHARRHHTGEAFPCQQCEYSSPDRQLLRRHVRRHHAPSQHATL
ncbi:zinc finger protein 64 [Centropristis striata]|uniref:zinc finger protein 64 n=1 Tax=Centropristis striata TaxID=184440 RepID=UPI0027E1A881|nr:zinc finger protein 64 [Centropristis striata]XP_059199818.1 zinc finger protein 64 [Centropristis striata]XP_059199819.1 zinc finger protein 64 [Centropristis striata]